MRPQPAREPTRSPGGAAGGKDVVDHQRTRPRRQGVAMRLQRVGPILECIVLADALPRQFSRLPRRHESRLQRGRHRAPENESAGLDGHHMRDAGAPEGIRHCPHDLAEQDCVAQHRGDVLKEDARFGIVRDRSDGAQHGFGDARGHPLDLIHWISKRDAGAAAGSSVTDTPAT
jgi:hypothetical protein